MGRRVPLTTGLSVARAHNPQRALLACDYEFPGNAFKPLNFRTESAWHGTYATLRHMPGRCPGVEDPKLSME